VHDHDHPQPHHTPGGHARLNLAGQQKRGGPPDRASRQLRTCLISYIHLLAVICKHGVFRCPHWSQRWGAATESTNRAIRPWLSTGISGESCPITSHQSPPLHAVTSATSVTYVPSLRHRTLCTVCVTSFNVQPRPNDCDRVAHLCSEASRDQLNGGLIHTRGCFSTFFPLVVGASCQHHTCQ
jgi:hypothetical protein